MKPRFNLPAHLRSFSEYEFLTQDENQDVWIFMWNTSTEVRRSIVYVTQDSEQENNYGSMPVAVFLSSSIKNGNTAASTASVKTAVILFLCRYGYC